MKITWNGREKELNSGKSVMECLLALGAPVEGALAVKADGRVLELYDVLTKDARLDVLTLRDEEGRRIYERSLRFVVLLALRRVLPGQRVRVEYSVGGGVFLCTPGHTLTREECARVEEEMRSIVAANLPFDKREWSLDDAIAYFAGKGQTDKVELLRRRPFPFFMMYACDGMWEYFYGAMVPSTGYVPVWGLTFLPERGLVFRLPTAEHPDHAAAYIDRPKHVRVFDQSAAWCSILGVSNAPDLSRLVEKKQLRRFIRVNEALQDKAIAEIADTIAQKGKRIVLIAGPSSSGKTTFAGRLAVQLRVLGFRPIQISLDNYYRNRDELPLEPDGTVDLEGLHTIDTALFQQQMVQLLEGETVEMPEFSFKKQKREPHGTPLTLMPGQPIIIEGIHGLNPELSADMPQEVIHRIFVSALTCINLDDHNRIRTTDVRLLRRIVRDMNFRGTTPEETLAMWPSVRRGEETWIFPYQERADSMLNSALHYELPVLRLFAYQLLKKIPPENPDYLTARRLVKILNYFPDISRDVLDEIPPLSLLREFIGGCTIDKE